MSLNSTGVSGEIVAHAADSPTRFQDSYIVANQPGLAFLENERKLVRDMVEAYLTSPQFVKDTYQLESTLKIIIRRQVRTSV